MLVTRPREFPQALLDSFRRGFRSVWAARGGGLYATGFFVTFVWLEIDMLIDDIVEATGVGDFFGEQLFELAFRYLSESLVNTLLAFLWPLLLLRQDAALGMIVLVGLYLLFPLTLKKPLERWLFDEPPADETDEPKH